jgi:hypothetical protein
MRWIEHASRKVVFFALALGLALPAGAALYEVQIDNLIPGGPETGQALTPPVVVVHGPGYTLFAEGDYASLGLEKLAEDGETADLVAEAMADPDVYQVVVGGGPFFGTEIVQVEGMPGDLLSLATMLARSNDLFTGLSAVALPAAGSVAVEPTGVYDAGTEENTGLIEHIPFYGNAHVGPDEDNPIAMISDYKVLNDPAAGILSFTFPPSARITITRLDPTPTEDSSWGRIRSLFR